MCFFSRENAMTIKMSYVYVAATPCSSHPCQNNGHCYYFPPNDKSYRCTCRRDFYGKSCEKSKNCLSDMCENFHKQKFNSKL